ncbi:MAG: 4Fe-4S binding protein [Dehalococcoidia bacterium]
MKDQSTQKTAPYSSGHNLLNNRLVGGLVKSRWYPGILVWPTAFAFAFIMYELLFGPARAHNNFGTALTWVLWWPLIPIIFVLAGRFWCGICPFGTLNDAVQRFAGHNRPVPVFLKKYGIWIIDATFILITWGDHVFGMVEYPWNSGVLMLMITTAVVVTAVLWERRTWCRHLCFLGGVSSNYSRTGMLELRATPEKCSQCKAAACYKGTEKAPGCPMFEFPKTMDSNAQCNLCGYCVKNCPNESITLKPRIWTRELWFVRKPRLEVTFLAVVIMGIVFVQNITMLDVWDSILNGLEDILHTSNFDVLFTVAFLIAMAIPIGSLALASFVAGKINGDSLINNFTKFGYAIIPLDVAGHIAHNLFHLLAEGRSVFVTGMEFAGREVSDTSPGLVGDTTIQILQYMLIVLGVAASLYTAYRIARSNYPNSKSWGTVRPYAVLIVLLGIANIVLFSLPMTMRM